MHKIMTLSGQLSNLLRPRIEEKREFLTIKNVITFVHKTSINLY